MIIGIDDNDSLGMFRLVNEPEGQEYLKNLGISGDVIEKLSWIGISGAANIIACIKFAKYYELTENDMVLTILTDSAELYQSRLIEMEEKRGRAYSMTDAALDYGVSAMGLRTDHVEELTYQSRKRIHNLKYYTWIEQQMYDVDELNEQWYDYENYWDRLHRMGPELDQLIEQFNDLQDQS
jgi:hypothetical protein